MNFRMKNNQKWQTLPLKGDSSSLVQSEEQRDVAYADVKEPAV